MANTIWTNDVTDILDSLKANPADKDWSDEELLKEAYAIIGWNLDDVINLDLNISVGENIVARGTIIGWDGAYPGAYLDTETDNIGQAVLKVLNAFRGENTFNVCVEDGKVTISQYGHDNPCRPSVITLGFENGGEQIIADKVNQVYGWDMIAA